MSKFAPKNKEYKMKFKFRNVGLASLILSASCLVNIATAGIIAPSEAGYTQVYGLNIDRTNLHNNVPYYLDNSGSIVNDSFDRIAYHVELQTGQGELEWLWVSMDAFTNNASLTGVPSFAGSNTSFQQLLTNMNVFSNKSGIVTGTSISTGNIEFWPYNYGPDNVDGIPNAGGNYDTGDRSAGSSSYGSMQIHNYGVGADQTLFALNRFGAANKDLGIGNSTGQHSDWTFMGNSGNYSVKTLDVYVTQVPEPSTLAIFALSLMGLAAPRFKK